MKNFKEQVYAIVAKIPKGKTMSYGEVAARAGAPGAARAVGSLMARNTNPNVPCHRVVRSDGSIGDYNQLQGPSKEELLRKEGLTIKNGRIRF